VWAIPTPPYFMAKKILSVDPEPGEPYAKTCCSKFRIVCHDDDEDTLYFDTKDGILTMIQTWFLPDEDDEEGSYANIKQFNKERRGIHTAQIKKKGRWVTAK